MIIDKCESLGNFKMTHLLRYGLMSFSRIAGIVSITSAYYLFGATSGFSLNKQNRFLPLLTSTALCSSTSSNSPPVVDKFAGTAFYPPIQPYFSGTLQVSSKHTIAYSIFGNPEGKPVLFVHGGPGGGTEANMARYFDPKVYRVILVDQRGCGQSTPFADLEDNTTYDSVGDFEKLRELLKVEKWQVFGGSWGSTLSLAYAVRLSLQTFALMLS